MSEKKSADIKLLQGNRGKRKKPNPAAEMSMTVGAPTPPPELEGDARSHWDFLVSVLLPARVLTPGDYGILLLACSSYEDIMRLRRALAKFATLTYTQKGSMGQRVTRQRLEVTMLANARKEYRRYLAELGLTPTSRNRAKVMPTKNEGSGVESYLT